MLTRSPRNDNPNHCLGLHVVNLYIQNVATLSEPESTLNKHSEDHNESTYYTPT
jgi:hypothetical protein